MVSAAVTFALLGLSAVGSAVPTPTTVDEKRQFLGIGPPIGGGFQPPGGNGGGLILPPGPAPTLPPCDPHVPIPSQKPCDSGIHGGPFRGPPHPKRFSLPDGWNKDIKQTIAKLELRLEALQNKSHKTQDDKDEIADLKAALKYIAGVTNISAPPGVGSVFIPGKMMAKRFSLPDGWNKDIKQTIANLELRLEALQNKSHKSQDDKDEIADIKACLKYIAGITNISAPPGVGSVFIPGKKMAKRFSLPDGWNKDIKQTIAQLELRLEALQNKSHKSQDDKDEIADIKACLKYIAGITNISAPPGVGSVFIPGKAKRFTLPDGWNKDVKETIAKLELRLEALQNKSHKSQDDKDEIADLKAALRYIAGITNISAPPGVGSVFIPGKRQSIGNDACKNAVDALIQIYGPPSRWPTYVQDILILVLKHCSTSTGPLNPDPTKPGGGIIPDPTHTGAPIVPDPTQPGAPLNPDPTVPGGAIVPDPTSPGAPINPSN